MKAATLGIVVLFGCSTSAPSSSSSIEPKRCAQTISLVGSSSSSPTNVGPLSLDTSGMDLCIHLDPTGLSRAHFMLDTPPQHGTTSEIASRLEDSMFAPILDGWDVTVGMTDPQTSMNLEWDPPTTAPTDIVVWVHGVSGEMSTTITMSLFDPLD